MLTAIGLTFLNIYELQHDKEQQINTVTTEFINAQKKIVKERVMVTSELIQFQQSQTMDLVQKRVKDRVDEAIHICNAFYETYHEVIPESQLKEQLRLILSHAVFDHPDGYFFAVDMETENIIIHKLEHMIGYSMSQHKDIRGTMVLTEQKELLSDQDGAFQIIYFSKPTAPDEEFPKQLYVRYFKPYNWLIGTGEYLDDIEKRLQDSVLERLETQYWEDSEDLFIKEMYHLGGEEDTPYGSIILSRNPIHKPGDLLYDTDLDSRGNYFRKDILTLLKDEGEGFLSYYFPSPEDGTEVKKTSFFFYDPTWEWTIGSGFYYNALEKQLALIEEEVNGKIHREIRTTLLFSLLIILIMSIVFLVISRRISKMINSYAERLEQSQKMDALGQLAGGIAHDFNNLLGGIIGAGELLTSYLPDKPDVKEYHHILMNSASRAAELTRNLLAFSKTEKNKIATVDVHSIIDETVNILKNTLDRRIDIITKLQAEKPIVSGDSSLIQSTCMNIGINASQAMAEGGTISITTRNVMIDDIFCKNSVFDIQPGRFLEIEIKDTGCGISNENLRKIFDPFFTTKEQGKGTGLGLSSVYGTIKQHSGAIDVYSKLGIGTSFKIFLPLTKNHYVEYKEAEGIMYGEGNILVVDDEEAMRLTAKAMLENLGYTVSLAENGKDAISLYKQTPNKFDLVILDMIMPVMNGKDCFSVLHEIDKGVRVILSSGFIGEDILDDMKDLGLKGFIRKPYLSGPLSRVVHEAITHLET